MSVAEILRDRTKLEAVERSAFRLVVQALRDYLVAAEEIFRQENDEPGDIAEDITREALDTLGMPRIPTRLFGKVDYKRAGYVFLPEQTVEVALLVDSKAEKDARTVTIQTSQTSMMIRQMRQGKPVSESGKLPQVIESDGRALLTVTIIVKYVYDESDSGEKDLKEVVLLCLPNGALQDFYNPDVENSFWLAGRNAPSRGEDFRVRVGIDLLASRAAWRVKRIPIVSAQ